MRRTWGPWILAVVVSGAALAGGDTRWVHVRVSEASHGDSRVDVQLPLSMIRAVVPQIVARVDRHGGIGIDGSRADVEEWRAYWSAVKVSRDGEYVTVRDGGDEVHIAKRGGFVLVDVNEHGERGSKVRMRLPVALVDAVIGHGDAIDSDALSGILADLPDGDLVTVDDDGDGDGDGEHVRIWIDGRPAPARDDE
jgi:hypothetical protein